MGYSLVKVVGYVDIDDIDDIDKKVNDLGMEIGLEITDYRVEDHFEYDDTNLNKKEV